MKLPRANTGSKRRRLGMRRHPSQARAQRTFGTVLDAAVGLIEREGVERATTRRIALAAGVSIGAVYEYFPNKESIVLHLGTQWLRRIREIVEGLHPARSAIADLLGYLDRMLREVETLYRNQPGVLAVVRLIGAIPELRRRASPRRSGGRVGHQRNASFRSRRGRCRSPVRGELHGHHGPRRAERVLGHASRRRSSAAAQLAPL